jgi:hypothetical protein
LPNESPITLQDFQDILDRCGADPAAWPADRRAAAQALVAGSADARARLDAAVALKQALSGPEVKAPAGLKDRILKAAKDDAPDE